MELNRYVYTANNPVNYDDPSGLVATTENSLLRKLAAGAIGALTAVGAWAAWVFSQINFWYVLAAVAAAAGGVRQYSSVGTETSSVGTETETQETPAVSNPALEEPTADYTDVYQEPTGGSGGGNGTGSGPRIPRGFAGIARALAIGFALAGLTSILSGSGGGTDTDQDQDRPRKHYHLTFGISKYLAPFWVNLTLQIRRIPNTEVLISSEWYSEGLTRIPTWNIASFNIAFQEATSDPRVTNIHFNLEGMVGDVEIGTTNIKTYSDYIQKHSGGGLWQPPGARNINFYVTAWELFQIRQQGLCGKTNFFENGSTSIAPSQDAWEEICT